MKDAFTGRCSLIALQNKGTMIAAGDESVQFHVVKLCDN